MSVLAGLFLVAHGLVHLAVWPAPPKEDAPFDPGHSWLLGDARRPARRFAITACTLLVAAGTVSVDGDASRITTRIVEKSS